MFKLGASLLRQGRHPEAEPLLLAAYEGMEPFPEAAGKRNEVLEGIVGLYEAWGKPERAAAWKAKTDPSDR